MAILITGGAGFIGSNFILQWLKKFDEPVVNLDKLTYAANLRNLASLADDERYIFVHGDIADSKVLNRIFNEYSPRAVVNFAAESHVDRSIHAPMEFIQTNVVGTFQLLEASRVFWRELAAKDKEAFRFLHVSTDEVYGSLKSDAPAFSELTRYEPNSPYSASKAASDHFVRAYFHTYGLPVLTTNCSNNYGPFQFPEKLIPLMILNALANSPLPVYGDGLQVRDWLHVTDHCVALQIVLESGRPGETYNIGGRGERRNIQVVNAVCEHLDTVRPMSGSRSYKDFIVYVKDRPGHDRRYAVDTAKIERELNWKPKYSFETGLKETVDWYCDNPAWVQDVTSGLYRDWVKAHYES